MDVIIIGGMRDLRCVLLLSSSFTLVILIDFVFFRRVLVLVFHYSAFCSASCAGYLCQRHQTAIHPRYCYHRSPLATFILFEHHDVLVCGVLSSVSHFMWFLLCLSFVSLISLAFHSGYCPSGWVRNDVQSIVLGIF
jgi:hypothetical protein